MTRIYLATLALLFVFVSVVDAADIAGTYTADITVANGDTWTGGDLVLNNDATLNIPAGATLTFDSTGGSAGRNLGGNGTFAIGAGGTFLLDTNSSNDNIVISGAVTMTNEGTLQIDCGADLRLNHVGSSFTNSGLIWKTQGTDGSANDPSYIFPASTSAGGKFVNEGDIRVDAGHLNISGARSAGGAASSTGGTFTVASGSQLSFTGGWTLLRGTSSITGSGIVALTSEDPAGSTGGIFVAMAPVTILDIGGDGLMWTTGILDANGNTLRNDGRLRLTGSGATVIGTGSVENGEDGTFQLQSGTLTLDGNDFTNQGTMTLEAGSGTVTVTGTGSLINGANGTFRLMTGTLAANASVINRGEMILDTAGTVTLSGSVPVTNEAGGLLTLTRGNLGLNGNNFVNNGTAQNTTDGNVTISSNGRFINNSLFNHVVSGGNDNFIISNTAVFENNGTYDFQGAGDIQLTNTASFVNNGLLMKTSAAGDPSFVFGNRGFTAAAGSEIRSSAGTLRIATGGTSVAGATWTADGGNLDVAGEWSGVIQGNSVGASRVRILSSANGSVASDLLVGDGGLTFNISGGGLVWSTMIINTQGRTLNNAGVFSITNGGTKTLSGGGTFINLAGATLNHTDGAVTLADNTTLRNQGQLNIPAGSGASSFDGVGSVINDSVGTIDWSGGAFGIASTVLFRNDGTMNISGSGTRTVTGGGQLLNSATGSFNWATASTISVDAGSTLRNEGAFAISGTGTHSVSGTGLFLNASGGTMQWEDGAALNIAAGATLQNDGDFIVSGLTNRTLAGGGTFLNNGTFDLNLTNSSGDNLTASTSGGEFVNNGLFLFREVADFEMRNGYTFTNTATGILRKTATTNMEQAQFFSFAADAGAGTFDNQGTVEVLGGLFRITTLAGGGSQFDDINLVQNDGAGTLTGGTWVANSLATGQAEIDLDPFGATSGIFAIGENAVVELTGANALLRQLGSLTQIDGGLYVNQKTFTGGGTLTVGATGVIGGSGTFSNTLSIAGTVTPGESRGAAVGTLSVSGNVLFQAGSALLLQIAQPTGQITGFDIATTRALIAGLPDQDAPEAHDSLDVSGSLMLNPSMQVQVTTIGGSLEYGQYFDLIDFSGLGIQGITEDDVAGILSLPDPGPYQWDTSLFISHGIIFVVPEPGRAMLLAAGLGLALLRRRRPCRR